MAVITLDIARRLRELIAAIDGRRPRTGHAEEASIARDSAALRASAVKRLEDEVTDPTGPVSGGRP